MASIREKKATRWLAMLLASLAVFGAYYFNYALSPIKPLLESLMGWTSSDFGTYTSAYGWLNVFLFMLIFSGIILDKLGVRKTGLGATLVMFIGTGINFWAVSTTFPEGATFVGLKLQVFWSAVGFALFGVGTEAIGITVSKAVVRWFKGKEMALAMGMQMAIARTGTLLALALSSVLADKYGVTGPIGFALILMLIGVASFLAFSVLDRKLDKSEEGAEYVDNPEDDFRISDIKLIISNKGFWYIAILCVLFYSAVFPFLFYATDLMINKYNVAPKLAGLIPSLLPFGTILLTPFFGGIYDKKGKGATIMILGSLILILVHGVLALPFLNHWLVAAIMVIVLGIGFSLVPSAMWPSVPKIIPEKQLGTAYAVIFWIQNIGLMSIPLLLGFVLDSTNPDVAPNKHIVKVAVEKAFTENMPKDVFTQKEIKESIEEVTKKTVDSIVQYAKYEPIDNSQLDTAQIKNDLHIALVNNLENIDYSLEKEQLKKQIIQAGEYTAYQIVADNKLNLRYDYQADMLIFVTLALLSLIFAFLLKAEDKKKGYGLELPNIEEEKSEDTDVE
jgi:MFS family permease